MGGRTFTGRGTGFGVGVGCGFGVGWGFGGAPIGFMGMGAGGGCGVGVGLGWGFGMAHGAEYLDTSPDSGFGPMNGSNDVHQPTSIGDQLKKGFQHIIGRARIASEYDPHHQPHGDNGPAKSG